MQRKVNLTLLQEKQGSTCDHHLNKTMLCKKFLSSRFLGSGEEDFLYDFIIYGNGGHLGQQSFCSPNPRRLNMKGGPSWSWDFREEVL